MTCVFIDACDSSILLAETGTSGVIWMMTVLLRQPWFYLCLAFWCYYKFCFVRLQDKLSEIARFIQDADGLIQHAPKPGFVNYEKTENQELLNELQSKTHELLNRYDEWVKENRKKFHLTYNAEFWHIRRDFSDDDGPLGGRKIERWDTKQHYEWINQIRIFQLSLHESIDQNRLHGYVPPHASGVHEIKPT